MWLANALVYLMRIQTPKERKLDLEAMTTHWHSAQQMVFLTCSGNPPPIFFMFLLQYLSQVTFFFGSFYLAKISTKFHPPFQLKTKVYLEFPIVSSSVMGLFHILYLGLACILFLGHFQILYLGPSFIKHSVSIICILTYFVIFLFSRVLYLGLFWSCAAASFLIHTMPF